MPKKHYNSVDLFSGCGGLTTGMHQAGFATKAAVEIDVNAVKAFSLNHKNTVVFEQDIRTLKAKVIKETLGNEPLHLLAGCPPCQGFSTIRRLNRNANVRDARNALLLEYLRLVRELKPLTLMLENVPGLKNYYLFSEFIQELEDLGYNVDYEIVNVKDYGVPQSRKRFVLVGSRLGEIKIAKGGSKKVTVRDAIGNLEHISRTKDQIHKIVATHTPAVQKRIELTPKNGGSRKDLPKRYMLDCHSQDNVGFNDIYGRLRWDDHSTTITGGCLNPSKGRFLHPTFNRCITAREAALLQSFPKSYKFPLDISKTSLALLIGNALPPKFSFIQSKNIKKHLDTYLGRQIHKGKKK